MLTLVLTRHGLTDRSEPEQHLGQRIDVSLNDAGRAQAQALAARLAALPLDRVVTSPLFRARETAEILAGGVRIEADPRLKEMNYGAWEGRTYAEIDAADADYRGRWETSPDVLSCPGGESGNAVATRVRHWLEELLAEHAAWHARTALRLATESPGAPDPGGRTVLAVGHATTNRILLSLALGLPVREYRQRFVQGQANVTILRWPLGTPVEKATLVTCNDRAHLVRPGEAPWS